MKIISESYNSVVLLTKYPIYTGLVSVRRLYKAGDRGAYDYKTLKMDNVKRIKKVFGAGRFNIEFNGEKNLEQKPIKRLWRNFI